MDLRAIPPELLVGALLVALAVILVQVAARAVGRSGARRALRARFEHAAAGEARSAALLEGRGYRLLGAQVATTHVVCVDDAPVNVTLRADYLVEKDGLRYVAEVKTGSVAPRIHAVATRRQLLEYRIAFEVDGVLLVDADEARVYVVTFPRLPDVAVAEPRAVGTFVLSGRVRSSTNSCSCSCSDSDSLSFSKVARKDGTERPPGKDHRVRVR